MLDLTRTFPNNKHYSQESTLFNDLNNLLNVISVVFPTMGYCQGLNFICAVVLLKLQQEQAYLFLYAVLGTRHHH
jgi:TBC1 domain-containing protein 4